MWSGAKKQDCCARTLSGVLGSAAAQVAEHRYVIEINPNPRWMRATPRHTTYMYVLRSVCMCRQQWQGIFDNVKRSHSQKRFIERRSGIWAKYRADVSEFTRSRSRSGFGIAFLSRW